MKDRIRFGIVGSGWRTEFFLRIAQLLPARFDVAAVMARRPERAKELRQVWGVNAVTSLPDLLATPEMQFVVVCVSQPAAPAFIEEVAAAGFPILTETPPAPTLDGLLQLQKLVAQGARLQVAEQYHLQPMHAARIALVRSGKLGVMQHANLSVAHGYHGTSLLRLLLGVGYENVSVQASLLEGEIVAGIHRDEPPPPERLEKSRQVVAIFKFESSKTGIFDFAGEQYFSWIRDARVVVRGTHGEIVQETLSYLKDSQTPIHLPLRREDTGHDMNLEGFHHKGIQVGDEWIYLNPVAPGRLADDEIAMAACLLGMDRYVSTGESFYSFAEAAQDQYLSLLIDQSLKEDSVVTSVTQPWAR